MLPQFITHKEKKEIAEKLKVYGIEKIPYLLLKSGTERLRAFSGNLTEQDILKFIQNIHIEGYGLYFARIDGDEVRLTIDACQLLKEQIKHKILFLTEKQFKEYMEGKDVEANKEQIEQTKERMYYVLKYGEDLLGMAKVVNNQIKNYLPKDRRRKS